MKIYIEYYKLFSVLLDLSFSFDFVRGFMGVVGLDVRYYLKIDKCFILVFCLVGVVLFGQDWILYYLGGMDNWLLLEFNNIILFLQEQFGFVILVNNLCGFDLNIRNGNFYVFINVEVRILFFCYFLECICLFFFCNFQLIGFFDVGMVWSGFDFYGDENLFNIIMFLENLMVFMFVMVRVVYFCDLLVFSYGVGVCMFLFGYMV